MFESNYNPLKDIQVGFNTTLLLRHLFNEADVDQAQSDKFLLNVQCFYKESISYILNKMNSKHDFWIHSVWINVFNRENAHWADVNYFIEKYKSIFNSHEHWCELLYDQFHEYKLVNENEVKLEEAIICEYDGGSNDHRIDTMWYLKSPVGNNCRFHLLFSSDQVGFHNAVFKRQSLKVLFLGEQE